MDVAFERRGSPQQPWPERVVCIGRSGLFHQKYAMTPEDIEAVRQQRIEILYTGDSPCLLDLVGRDHPAFVLIRDTLPKLCDAICPPSPEEVALIDEMAESARKLRESRPVDSPADSG